MEEVGAEMTGQTNCNTINAALGYSKRLACVKWCQSESSKAHRVQGASLMKARYPKKKTGGTYDLAMGYILFWPWV